ALGHQQRVGQLLLRNPFGRADVGKYVELRRAEPPAAQVLAPDALDLVADPYQPQPGEHRRLPKRGASRSSARVHVFSLVLNLLPVKGIPSRGAVPRSVPGQRLDGEALPSVPADPGW